MRHRWLAILLLVGALGLAVGGVAAAQRPESSESRRQCPAGSLAEREREPDGRIEIECVPAKRPEPVGEMLGVNAELGQRFGAGVPLVPGTRQAALDQRTRLAAAPLPAGATNAWRHLATSPLKFDDAEYPAVTGLGFVDVQGRASDFAADPADPRHMWAAFANGGLWETTDDGETWHSVGDTLPMQSLGAVEYIAAGGGTLLVGTSIVTFGLSDVPGLGVWRSTDRGRTWQRSAGMPDVAVGAMKVDPTNPRIVYAGTLQGLFRSEDGGTSWVNVRLPTGCAQVDALACFLGNIVTDVIVRPHDRNGRGGGRVLAAVGWRAGDKPRVDGRPQSSGNGVYISNDGRPGTFAAVPTFTSTVGGRGRIGRVSLAVADGPGQDHNIVFAAVQDAARFNGASNITDPDGFIGSPILGPGLLNGVFGSTDFGATWFPLATPESGLNGCVTTSALCLLGAPGQQSWANLKLAVDPTTQDSQGRPTQLVVGLEEVFRNQGPIAWGSPVPATAFVAVGRYYGGSSCLLAGNPTPVPCPFYVADPAETTTHPDVQSMEFVPDGRGGSTFWTGNDGGIYKQHLAAGATLSNQRWGKGANVGIQTLMPYDAAMAKDGVVYAGLQDNGQMKITTDGVQRSIYGGDGFFTAVDPDNSNVVYEEYTEGAISVSTDGGRTWRSMNPGLDNAAFSTPFAMDPLDPRHLITGGRQVMETVHGPETGRSGATDWVQVADLGQSPTGAVNRVSATAVRGHAAYVGFCGWCDQTNQGVPFGRGLATNVGASKPPRKGSSDGWHFAAGRGLPNRIINAILIDPDDSRTVYAALGAYGRRWIAPGALGESTAGLGDGHLYKSTDAGESFVDISGDLPEIPAMAVTLHKGDLVVATEIGVFTAAGRAGGSFRLLGTGLPIAPIMSIKVAPQDPDVLYVSAYGRGVWIYDYNGRGRLPAVPGTRPPVPTPDVIPATGRRGPWALYGAGAVVLALAGLALLRRASTERSG